MYYDEPTVSDVLFDTLVIIGDLALLGGGGTNLAFSILFFQAADYLNQMFHRVSFIPLLGLVIEEVLKRS